MNMWFSNDNRTRLLETLKRLEVDEQIFEKLFSRFFRSVEQINLTQVEPGVIEEIGRKETSPLLAQIHKLVDDDAQVIHLFIELRKRGIVSFTQGSQQQHFTALI